MAVTALLLRVHDDGHGPWAVTALLLVTALPVVALAGVTGRVADSLDSRKVLLRASVVQALAGIGLVFVAPLWATLLLVAVLQSGYAFTTPVWSALVPRIVGDEMLARAVAAQRGLATLAGVAGGALGGILVGWRGPEAALAVDAATFVVLVAAAAALRTRRAPQAGEPPIARGWSSLTEGLSLLTNSRLVTLLFSFLALFVLVVESANVAEVFLIRDALSGSLQALGYVTACAGVGGVAGAWIAGRAKDDRQRVAMVVAGLVLSGVGIAGLGVAPGVLWVALGYVLIGGLNVLTLACLWPMLTLRMPEQARGRVFAATGAVMTVASLSALGIGGVVVSLVGPRATYVGAGLLAVLVGLALAVRLSVEGLDRLIAGEGAGGDAAGMAGGDSSLPGVARQVVQETRGAGSPPTRETGARRGPVEPELTAGPPPAA